MKTLRQIKPVTILKDTLINLETSDFIIPKGQLVKPFDSIITKRGDGIRTFKELPDQFKAS